MTKKDEERHNGIIQRINWIIEYAENIKYDAIRSRFNYLSKNDLVKMENHINFIKNKLGYDEPRSKD